MKTSMTQFEMIVQCMEVNGDLSKQAEGAYNRIQKLRHWHDLTRRLNLDKSGHSRPSEKWKKVWSDFKNNTKRKIRKLINAGGDYESKITPLEKRVLIIMGYKLTDIQTKQELIEIEDLNGESESQQPESQSVVFVPSNETSHLFYVESLQEEQNTSAPGAQDDFSDASSSSSSTTPGPSHEKTVSRTGDNSFSDAPKSPNQASNINNSTQTVTVVTCDIPPLHVFAPKKAISDGLKTNVPNNNSSRNEMVQNPSQSDVTETQIEDSDKKKPVKRKQYLTKTNRRKPKFARGKSSLEHSNDIEALDDRWANLFSNFTDDYLQLRRRELRIQERWLNLFNKCINCFDKHFSK